MADTALVRAPEEALETFFVPPDYYVQLVAAEPLVEAPIAIDFDADGRMWVVEMRGYMPDLDGKGEDRPAGRIVVLEDVDDDGRMDRRTVYLDSLVLPRAVKVLSGGVLVAAPPYLWMTYDRDGDLRADAREVVRADYGDPASNPEHNANGLVWGLDNWIHSARYDGRLRLQGGGLVHAPTREVGQWGVGMDDVGRLYRNYNEDPLHVDLLDAHYFARNPALLRTRGVYEATGADRTVWPVRPTPGVNRGYRDQVLRADGTLRSFTSAGSPVVYRGDRLPEALRGDVFVTEPAGNLVRRFILDETEDGFLRARNAYEGAEFMASTDERFRPVNLFSAPDGTLYVVDMYRGVIQHRQYVTGYLAEQVRRRRLEGPLGMGRIYRVVHRSTRRAEPPRLSSETSAGLVGVLSHPNGWWRDTAQRLLVERGDTTVAPALRRQARTAGTVSTRLHALWTLDGLGAAEAATLRAALADPSPHVRAAAVRIAEPHLSGEGAAEDVLRAAVLARVDDAAPPVRRQLAATAGALPVRARDTLLARLLARHAADPVVLDAALSGLRGREAVFLAHYLAADTVRVDSGRVDAIRMLAATALNAGDGRARQYVFDAIGDPQRPAWQRLALLDGVATFAPAPDGGEAVRRTLAQVPHGLLEATEAAEAVVRVRAQAVAARLDWPGKPHAEPAPAPLSAEERQRFAAGAAAYGSVCAPCHQAGGQGLAGVARSLVGSRWVLGPPERLARIVLHGKEGEMLMPAAGAALSDAQVAAILTYVRRAWGNQASPVAPGLVHEVRGETLGRARPWTEDELAEVGR